MIRDQEDAGLDIVTDGQMWYDDYVGVIGSFCWYMYERIMASSPRRTRILPRSARRFDPRTWNCLTIGAGWSTAAR